MIEIPIAGGAYLSLTPEANPEDCLNMYAVQDPTGGRPILVGLPGLRLLATLSEKPIRGFTATESTLYVVAGNRLYALDKTFQATPKAGASRLVSSSGRVSMVNDGIDVLICDGTNGYVYQAVTDTLLLLNESDHGFLGGETAEFQDDYFISSSGDTFYFSEDATNWDVLDSVEAEATPANIKAIVSMNRELWVLKSDHIEIFWNSAETGSDVVWRRTSGGNIEIGLKAKHSVAVVDNMLYFLASDGSVRRAANQATQTISTPALAWHISQYADAEDAVGFGYEDGQRPFYEITFPESRATWIYDASLNLWYRRSSLISGTTEQGAHRVWCYAFFGGKHIVGDRETGDIYELAGDEYTENGSPILRSRVTKIIEDSGRWLYFRSMRLLAETGTATGMRAPEGDQPASADYEPAVILSWSDDGGRTWSNPRFGSLRTKGEFAQEVNFRALGASRRRCFRLETSAPVKISFLGLLADIQAGAQ